MGDVTSGGTFAFLVNFTRPWAPIQRANVLAEVFLESKISSESLEPLIDFLAYLEPKLWQKKQFLAKIKKFHKR